MSGFYRARRSRAVKWTHMLELSRQAASATAARPRRITTSERCIVDYEGAEPYSSALGAARYASPISGNAQSAVPAVHQGARRLKQLLLTTQPPF